VKNLEERRPCLASLLSLFSSSFSISPSSLNALTDTPYFALFILLAAAAFGHVSSKFFAVVGSAKIGLFLPRFLLTHTPFFFIVISLQFISNLYISLPFLLLFAEAISDTHAAIEDHISSKLLNKVKVSGPRGDVVVSGPRGDVVVPVSDLGLGFASAGASASVGTGY